MFLLIGYIVLSLEQLLLLTRLIMARRNSYLPPIPEPQPIHPSNHPNTNLHSHFGSSMLVPDENRLFSNSGALHDLHQQSQSTALSSQSQQYFTHYGPCNHRAYRNDNSGNTISSQAESGRMSFKRKQTQPTFEDTRGYCCPGSSSTVTVPPTNFQHNPIPACFRSPASMSIGHSHGTDSRPAGDGFQRNVRSRYDPCADSPAGQCWFNNRPYQMYTSENIYATSMAEQCVPPLHVPSLPSQVSVTRRARASSSRFNGRQTHNRISSCYAQPGNSAAASQYAASSVSRSALLPRYPRPATWNGESRSFNLVLPLPNDQNARARRAFGVTHNSASMDALSIFGPLDLSDEHRELRLDIDDMSYEELLALEESIGNVSTGLSEYHISLCLSQTIYCSSDPAQECREEVSCPICLEDYEDKESMGILKCRHVYHVSCIKNWLSIKNACPICKAPAVDDILKRKGKATSSGLTNV
ncbi:hypothetical protein HPP92_012047 [Vanilla planifolia]|uniref:RING-type E3 ubiquitin transferase n=1 Tax=Vanilla planifolia TaxID=51239 RepID=A0A835QYS8_VANPL|nr:hypothetical protein HPP92_012047 [Vanilla planifolia]